MNEISKKIIIIGKLIGKKVFVKRYVSEGYNFINDTEFPEIFTVKEFENYAYDLLNGKIELLDIIHTEKFGDYYLIVIQDK